MNNKKEALQVIDLSVGAGGNSLGYENAGCKIILGITKCDKSHIICRTNRPEWKIKRGDPINIEFNVSTDIILCSIPTDVYKFSALSDVAIILNNSKNKIEMPKNYDELYIYSLLRIAKETKCKAFVFESLPTLLKHDAGLTIDYVLIQIKEAGYHPEYALLNANDYGVAQKKERLFIVAIRNDIYYANKSNGTKFKFPEPQKTKKVLSDIIKDTDPEIAINCAVYKEEKQKVLALVPQGGCWIDLPIEVQKSYLGSSYKTAGGKRGIARRLAWDKPAPTLMASPSQKQTDFCHPDYNRPLSVKEYSLIQSFPENWTYPVSITDAYKIIANDIPPLLSQAIAKELIDYLCADELSDWDD